MSSIGDILPDYGSALRAGYLRYTISPPTKRRYERACRGRRCKVRQNKK
jgi:hypothetical protein